MAYELCPVRTAEDWRDMHDIRREVLFTPERHPEITYDFEHPDDRSPDNTPFLLKRDGRSIGVVRLDARSSGDGVVRLVAIRTTEQRLGHGRVLDELIAKAARQRGLTRLLVNAVPDGVGFYRRQGWQEESWDPSELIGMAAGCVQMVKAI